MVQRSGRVAAVTVRNAKAKSLMPHLRKRVLPASVVYTDELRSYDSLKRAGYQHRSIQVDFIVGYKGIVSRSTFSRM
jgi:transposase